jgi:hypothetical protein
VPRPTRVRAARRAAIGGICGLLLAGCTSSSSQTATIFGGLIDPPDTPAPTAVAAPTPMTHPDRGTCSNATQCKAVLKAMIESPDRGWIGRQQPPDVYANGTRLFAYRALRRQLTCRELGMAVDELAAVSKAMSRPVGGMAADQVARTRALSSQVQGELANERAGRCKI